MDRTIQLYEEEIEIYKSQIELLKTQYKNSEEKTDSLTKKIRELQNLIEQANIANKDLETAFEHIRQENLKLQVYSGPQQPQIRQDSGSVVSNENNDLALEKVQRQCANLAFESVTWLSEKDKLRQKVNFLERECERYQRDNSTLSKQVRNLLQALEEERGMIIRRSNQVTDYNRHQITALDVIDNNLVTFESIEELQQQNQKLLSLVKQLAKDEEDRETKIENEDIKKLNSDIKSLKIQLEDVKNDRERIVNAFNMILKERDLFKILLCKTRQVEHMTPEIFQRMVSIACSSGPAITNGPDVSDKSKDEHIIDLKAMISKLENELKDSREQMETFRRRSEEEIRLKTELLDQATTKLVSETQQLKSLSEKNQILEDNIKSLTAEFDDIRTKNNKLAFELQQMNSIKERNEELEAYCANFIKEQNQIVENNMKAVYKELSEIRARAQLSEEKLQQMNSVKEKCAFLEAQTTSLRSELVDCKASSEKIISGLHQHISTLKEQSKNLANDETKELTLKIRQLESDLCAAQEELTQCKLRYGEHIVELQRLRNIEREARLELSRQLYKLSGGTYEETSHQGHQDKFEDYEMEQDDEIEVYIENEKPQPQPNLIQMAGEPYLQLDPQPEFMFELQPEPQPELHPEPQPEPHSEPQPVSQPELHSEPQPRPEPELHSEPQPVSQPELHPEPQPGPQPELQPEPQPESQPELGREQESLFEQEPREVEKAGEEHPVPNKIVIKRRTFKTT